MWSLVLFRKLSTPLSRLYLRVVTSRVILIAIRTLNIING